MSKGNRQPVFLPLGTKPESSSQSITAADAVEWQERKVRGGAGPGLCLSGANRRNSRAAPEGITFT
jgi:hypothetical protein